MSIDLILINPNARNKIYQGLSALHTAVEPPLWCRLIAGYIQERGFKVDIIDAEAEELSKEQVVDRIIRLEPRLIAVVAFGHQPSASTQQMVGVRDVLDELAYMQVTIPSIIIGGHASALPERTISEENCTYVCKGEGPVTILGLLQEQRPDQIPGLVWQNDLGNVTINPSAPLLDLDELGGDVWQMLPMRQYRAHNWQCFDGSSIQPYASIYTSLSCPFACQFCCIQSPFGSNQGSYRLRKPTAVLREIDNLHTHYGVSTFKIIDEMFLLNYRHVNEICDGLINLGYADELNFWAYARVDTVKPQILTKLRKAGFRWLALGIESGSEHVRDGAEKHLDQDDIIKVVREIQNAGINVIGNFIFGLPDDTLASMEETLNLAKELNCEFANFYSAMAYPGSKLYAVANKARLPQRWSGYSQHSYDCLPLATNTLSSEEVLAFRDAAFMDYFNDEKYLGMINKKFGGKAVSQVEAMLKVPLRREILGT